VVDLSPEVTSRARVLLVKYPLRAGDALQLACALVLQSRLPRPIDAFVASDQRLLDAADAERLAIVRV
jgi:predicted nucleic acid-binding protein